MKNEKIKKAITVIKPILNKTLMYCVIGIAIVSSFFLGRFSENYKSLNEEINVVKVKKEQVNIAVDENNHLIIIDNKTGNYTIYQDSIGHTIFKLYARNIWTDHTSDDK